jgi:putative membrane protein
MRAALSDWPVEPVLWLSLLAAGLAYALGVRRLHGCGKRWSRWRSVSYGAGLAAVAVGLVSPLAAHDEDFRVHMIQHMLLGMLGPLLLALSAPITLTLRCMPPRARRAAVRVLHTRSVRVLAHPVTASTIFVMGMLGLYFTPLYNETLDHPLLHAAVHLHLFGTGCLLAWTFIGVDPMPRPGAGAVRISALLIALGSHAALAKLLYGGYGAIHATSPELRQGAELMYYGGDAIDLVLVLVFFAQWYAAGGRRLRQARRRKEQWASAHSALSNNQPRGHTGAPRNDVLPTNTATASTFWA